MYDVRRVVMHIAKAPGRHTEQIVRLLACLQGQATKRGLPSLQKLILLANRDGWLFDHYFEQFRLLPLALFCRRLCVELLRVVHFAQRHTLRAAHRTVAFVGSVENKLAERATVAPTPMRLVGCSGAVSRARFFLPRNRQSRGPRSENFGI